MLTDRQKKFLSCSAEFQKILTEDKIIAMLSAPQQSSEVELLSLMELLGGLLTVCDIPVQPITPAVWSFLWSVENHYVTDRQKITPADTDLFLFVLTHGLRDLDFPLSDIVAKSAGWIPKLGLAYDVVASELLGMIRLAFLPLDMLPYTSCTDDTGQVYNAYWLASICSVVCPKMNMPYREVIYNTPLSTCFYFYLASLTEAGVKGIHRRTSGETTKEIVQRAEFLGEKFLNDHPEIKEF